MKSFCESLGVDYKRIQGEISKDVAFLRDGLETGYSVTPITRGASNRGYCRIDFGEEKSSYGLPSTVIVMVLSEPDPHKGIEEVTRISENIKELPFVNALRHFRQCGVAVPELYRHNKDAGLLYIEDFGRVMLRDAATGGRNEDKKRYFEAATDELVKLHVRATSLENENFIGFKIRFDRDLLLWELNHFTDYAVRDRFAGKPLPSEDKEIKKYFDMITDWMLETPYILCHRDYQLDNLLVQNDSIKVIDFQDALMGPLPYDLACLLYDRDTSLILGEDLIEHLVNYYAERYSHENPSGIDRKNFRRQFDLCVLHRAFKVVGRFYYIHSVKKRDEFLKWIPPMYAALNSYLNRFPELTPLRDIFAGYIEEMR